MAPNASGVRRSRKVSCFFPGRVSPPLTAIAAKPRRGIPKNSVVGNVGFSTRPARGQEAPWTFCQSTTPGKIFGTDPEWLGFCSCALRPGRTSRQQLFKRENSFSPSQILTLEVVVCAIHGIARGSCQTFRSSAFPTRGRPLLHRRGGASSVRCRLPVRHPQTLSDPPVVSGLLIRKLHVMVAHFSRCHLLFFFVVTIKATNTRIYIYKYI